MFSLCGIGNKVKEDQAQFFIAIVIDTLFFYKHTGKLGWSSICLRFSQFKPEIMLDGMLNLKTHFMEWYCVWYERGNGLFWKQWNIYKSDTL